MIERIIGTGKFKGSPGKTKEEAIENLLREFSENIQDHEKVRQNAIIEQDPNTGEYKASIE